MRAIIQTMDMVQSPYHRNDYGHSEISSTPQITATVLLVGEPSEARELMERRDLEIRPIEPAVPAQDPNAFKVGRGDKVKYRFLRGARSGNPVAETSKWMTVKQVTFDQLIVVDEESGKDYEFTILACQITNLSPKNKKKSKVKVWKDGKPVEVDDLGRLAISNLADPSPLQDAVVPFYVKNAVAALALEEANDPASELRRKVKEFNLV